ncbi:hypothetical protein BKA93DRAFT_121121 [Sparassis latifolia]
MFLDKMRRSQEPIPVAVGIISLSHKYNIESLLDKAISRLKEIYPTVVGQLDALGRDILHLHWMTYSLLLSSSAHSLVQDSLSRVRCIHMAVASVCPPMISKGASRARLCSRVLASTSSEMRQ